MMVNEMIPMPFLCSNMACFQSFSDPEPALSRTLLIIYAKFYSGNKILQNYMRIYKSNQRLYF